MSLTIEQRIRLREAWKEVNTATVNVHAAIDLTKVFNEESMTEILAGGDREEQECSRIELKLMEAVGAYHHHRKALTEIILEYGREALYALDELDETALQDDQWQSLQEQNNAKTDQCPEETCPDNPVGGIEP